MTENIFSIDEIPYDDLEHYGLTREMIEDLPERCLTEIVKGNRSPILPMTATGDDGKAIHFKARFAVAGNPDGERYIVFFPRLEHCPIDNLPQTVQEQLQEGRTIVYDFHLENGDTEKKFIQIDPGTRQLLACPTPVIGRNLLHFADDMELSAEQLTALQNGDIVTFEYDGIQFSAGISLLSASGVNVCGGDAEAWKRQYRQEMTQYNFGIYGCWKKEDDGSLSYIKEEDFSPEIIEAQRSSARMHMHR